MRLPQQQPQQLPAPPQEKKASAGEVLGGFLFIAALVGFIVWISQGMPLPWPTSSPDKLLRCKQALAALEAANNDAILIVQRVQTLVMMGADHPQRLGQQPAWHAIRSTFSSTEAGDVLYHRQQLTRVINNQITTPAAQEKIVTEAERYIAQLAAAVIRTDHQLKLWEGVLR